MEPRTLTITLQPDWRAALKQAALGAATADHYSGETLNFDSPAAFFSQLTERRWAIVNALLGAGEVGVRELARQLERDVKRVHEDCTALVALGLIERNPQGRLLCPFADIHVDMHLRNAA